MFQTLNDGYTNGLTWTLLWSAHLNSGLLHTTLAFNSGTKGLNKSSKWLKAPEYRLALQNIKL
jgi:hypothetical protein